MADGFCTAQLSQRNGFDAANSIVVANANESRPDARHQTRSDPGAAILAVEPRKVVLHGGVERGK